jgi:dolichol-phosphate mannosyltransferase
MADESTHPLLSVIIPAHNEEENLEPTVQELVQVLRAEHIPLEVILVNDNSTDATGEIADRLAARLDEVRVVTRQKLGGFGRAIRAGLEAFQGDVVVLVMADRSDNPRDVVRYYRKIEDGYDCVFGSRFRKASTVTNYPLVKLLLNRTVNKLIQLLFWTRFNDLTNAFKAFRRRVIMDCGPYSSSHFNITIEMSLSALIRKYYIAEIPIDWCGRTWGASNLSLSKMGRRYLSVLLKLFFEKLLIGDDIFEERLAERAWATDRLASVEARIGALEAGLERVRSRLEIESDAVAGPSSADDLDPRRPERAQIRRG